MKEIDVAQGLDKVFIVCLFLLFRMFPTLSLTLQMTLLKKLFLFLANLPSIESLTLLKQRIFNYILVNLMLWDAHYSERNWNLRIPGFVRDEIRPVRGPKQTDTVKKVGLVP